MGDDNFSHLIRDVAERLLGDFNKKASDEKRGQLRFGNHASMAVDVGKGTWFSHQDNVGGGVLDLVMREAGAKTKKDAADWLKENGFDVVDDRQQGEKKKRPEKGSNRAAGPKMKPVATWDYLDRDGNLLFQVVRMEDGTINPKDGKKNKSYRQRQPDPDRPGDYIWKTDGLTMVPYRLPDLIKDVESDSIIFITEGEKAADRLLAEGAPATTNARGALKWQPELNEWFRDAEVVILPDNDPQSTFQNGKLKFHDDGRPMFTGQDHAEMVAMNLLGIARSVKILPLPDLPLKGDVVDWLDAGGELDQLYELADKTPRFRPRTSIKPSRFNTVLWGDRHNVARKRLEFLIDGWMTEAGVSWIGGPSSSGKSFMAFHMAMCIARGLPFFGNDTRKCGVIYQAGEGGGGFQNRMDAYEKHFQVNPNEPIPFALIPTRINLFDQSQNDVEDLIKHINEDVSPTLSEPAGILFIDTYNKATAGADEISGKDNGQIYKNIERIREECGLHVCIVHHMNAAGVKMRGHSSMRDDADQVILVAHDKETGLRKVVLDKIKDGVDGMNFEFTLTSVGIGENAAGKEITSCVCLTVSEKEKLTKEEIRRGAYLTPNEQRFMTQFFEASRVFGVLNTGAPKSADGVDLQSMPTKSEGKVVVKWSDFQETALKSIMDPDMSLDAKKKRIVSQFEKVKDSLIRKNVLSVERPYMWWNKRPVQGFSHTFPERRGSADASERDFSEGMREVMNNPDGEFWF